MHTIAIVVNDPLGTQLFQSLKKHLNIRVEFFKDFDSGLQFLVDKSPEIVFFLDDSGAVSSEHAILHVRMLLDEKSPRFIQLTKEQSVCSYDQILLGVSVAETSSKILEFLVSLYGSETVISRIEKISTHQEPVPVPVSTISRKLATPDSEFSSDSELISPVSPVKPSISEDVLQEVDSAFSELEAPVIKNERFDFRRLIKFGGASVLILAPLLFFGSTLLKPTKTTAKATSSVVVSTPAPFSKTSSSRSVVSSTLKPDISWKILRILREQMYSKAHPGWSQYLMPGYELRIFSTSNRIQALQCISKSSASIQETLDTLLLELFGTSHYSLTNSTKIKDSIKIVTAKTDSGNLFDIYFQNGKIIAFVIEL